MPEVLIYELTSRLRRAAKGDWEKNRAVTPQAFMLKFKLLIGICFERPYQDVTGNEWNAIPHVKKKKKT